jgi:hypothetical protein
MRAIRFSPVTLIDIQAFVIVLLPEEYKLLRFPLFPCKFPPSIVRMFFLNMLFSDTFTHAFPLMWDTGIHTHTKHHIKRAGKVSIKVPLINCVSCPVASLLHTRLFCNMLLGSLVIFSLPECNLCLLTDGWWVAGWSVTWWCWSDDHRRWWWRRLPLTAARKSLQRLTPFAYWTLCMRERL